MLKLSHRRDKRNLALGPCNPNSLPAALALFRHEFLIVPLVSLQAEVLLLAVEGEEGTCEQTDVTVQRVVSQTYIQNLGPARSNRKCLNSSSNLVVITGSFLRLSHRSSQFPHQDTLKTSWQALLSSRQNQFVFSGFGVDSLSWGFIPADNHGDWNVNFKRDNLDASAPTSQGKWTALTLETMR
ncbi:hypothetical protein ElyMa_000420000 [Elysia marginata]|uniref:Uncharacterized protein n=1 Tax=Elysia marginata TaxID=1093978 RepID=A0AAV4FKS5_9GAST|nr:hypothetical protein ElyMa_000420000 [Elysia marginata]